ncbi:MAG: DNA replication and repair protein RecF [Alteromonas naphthalenivorans]|jgi:DNA replication and repair protein RecF
MTVCIQRLQVKNFRCFSSQTFDLDSPIVVIEGLNGSGKTSLLEALHYACYLKSFRTHIPRDLIAFESENFFINATCRDHSITVGSSGGKKQVKVDKKPITSYKELREYYRVVTITEDDLLLVKGSPEKRRSFLDHALILLESSLSTVYKQFKQVLDQRNALLQRNVISQDEFLIWTRKVWELSQDIQKHREIYLSGLVKHVQSLCERYWPDKEYVLRYNKKEIQAGESFEAFVDRSTHLFEREKRYRRSLFGAHLDDIEIVLNKKKARLFSSRGQQKLIVLLLKIAQVSHLIALHGKEHILLLIDDFMTDFDNENLETLMSACLDLEVQIIFASPIKQGPELIFLNRKNIPSLKVSI